MKCCQKVLVLIVLLSSLLSGQTSTQPETYKFPDAWLGVWEGKLYIYQGQKVVQEILMKVENLPTDSTDIYTWALTYGEDKISGRRDYVLSPIDKDSGKWVIDEKNSIYLEGKVVANSFITLFQVSGNHLSTSMQLVDKSKMIFEIIVSGSAQSSVSGNTNVEGEEIPEVLSFPVKGYQRAVLTKIR